jgi:transglutaminase-like putative cysteine protease
VLPAAGVVAFLALALGALIYVVMPQPVASDYGLRTEVGAPDPFLYDNPGWVKAKGQGERASGAGGSAGGAGSSSVQGAARAQVFLSPPRIVGRFDTRRALSDPDAEQTLAADRALPGLCATWPEESNASVAPGAGASNPTLFWVRADRPLFLRARTYDCFDGTYWHFDSRGRAKHSGHGRFPIFDRESWGTVPYAVSIETTLTDAIPAAYRPEFLRFPASHIEYGEEMSLRAPAALQPGTRYYAESVIHYIGRRRAGDAQPAGDGSRATRLPETTDPRLIALAKQLAAQERSPLARAVAIERYVATHAVKGCPNRAAALANPSEAALFNSGTAHQEAIASALAVMLRAANIPARVVTGFRLRRFHPLLGRYEVTETDRYAWAEGYIENTWVLFDAKPGERLPETKRPATPLAALVQCAEVLRHDAEDPCRVRAAEGWAGAADRLWADAKLSLMWPLVFAMHYWHWLALAAIALAAAYWYWVRSGTLGDALDGLRLRLGRRRSARTQVLLCALLLERACARRRLPRGHGENHAEFAARVILNWPHLAPYVGALSEAFGAARYGARPVSTATSQAALTAYRRVMLLLASDLKSR